MSRILVFMSDNRRLEHSFEKAAYNSLVAAINYEYCKLHGYDFLYYRPYLDNKDETKLLNCKNAKTNSLRHSSWSKLLSTSLALELEYDYIVYIDSDCIFKDFNQPLDQFIESYLDRDVLFLNNKPWNPNMPCAGFYICRVNERTRGFLRDWYAVDVPEKDKVHAWEQDALWRIFKRYNIGVIDSWMFEEKNKQFLRHVSSCEKENRIAYFTSFIHLKSIDYDQNISNVKVIEFDTGENGDCVFKSFLLNK